MKNLAVLLIILFAFISCEDPTCTSIQVGSTYVVCSSYSENPFEKQGRHEVTIVDKQNGYVQYRKTNGKTLFSRSIQAFVELTENCN